MSRIINLDPMNANQATFKDGWDVYRIAALDDPYPVWAAIREESPVLDAGGGVFFVSAFELANEALRHPAVRAGSGVAESFGATEGPVYDVATSWLMSLDGEEHQRARGLVRREFTSKRVEALRPFIDAAADRLAREFATACGEQPSDLVPALAFALPSEVIRSLFAIDADEWQRDVVPLIAPTGEPATDPTRADAPAPGAAVAALAEYFRRRIERGGDAGGLLAQLRVADPESGRLSDRAVIANAVLLVTAAIDTTTGLVANTVACLLSHPDQLARVRAHPELVVGVVEETLRFEPPALSCSRTTVEPITLGGVAIPAGSHLLVCIGAANRDPRRFPDPDRFDVERPVERGAETLSFGGGRHFCLGAALARLEAQVAVRALLEHAPDIALHEPIAWRKDSPTVRAPAHLVVSRAGRC